MPRIACALAQLITRDPNSPCTSRPVSPVPRKTSIKSKPSWRSSSVHTDNRIQTYKCPFTATRALTAKTKKEIDAYTSSEEMRSPTMSFHHFNEGEELEVASDVKDLNRRSLAIKYEDHRTRDSEDVINEAAGEKSKVNEEKKVDNFEKNAEDSPMNIQRTRSASISKACPVKDTESTSPESDNAKITEATYNPGRKTSCTLALDVYKRRGSILTPKPRKSSLTVHGDKLNALKEKFGTPEKAMHFFGRCFVKFFTNYG